MGREKVPEGAFSGGFVRNRGEGRGVRVARAKVSEIPIPDATSAQERSLAIVGHGPYAEAVKPLKVRQTKLAVMGIPASVLGAGDPRYARCVKLAQSWKKARQKEMYVAYGYVSSGVGALLAAAGLALSASRFLYEVAAQTEVQPTERGHLGMPQLLKIASSLGDSARQNELAAWELCARESVVRKRNEQNSKEMPWVVTQSGAEVGRAGRPRKSERSELERSEGVSERSEGLTDAGTDYSRETESSDTEAPWDTSTEQSDGGGA